MKETGSLGARSRLLRKSTFVTLAVACMPVLALAENLRLVTGELPPYATQERPDSGIALDIVRKAFANAGTTVSYTFKPWTRSLEEARAGQWDGTAYWGKNPTRDVGFFDQ